MRRLEGKTALVSGGAGGIGGAIARRFVENGCTLVITDLNELEGEKAAADLRAAGGSATFIRHDVASEASWIEVIDSTMKIRGRLDILVNAAGIFPEQPVNHIDEIALEEWRRIMAINLDGTFLGTRSAVRAMKKGAGGSIVNIASTAGHIGTRAGAAYGASKGGVRMLTVQAAISSARKGYNIRVNSISPGYIWTPKMESKLLAEFGTREEAQKVVAARNPLGRVAEPDDVAWAAIYLASDESRMVTATDLIIDGGMLAS
jgi:NAD(P)-dependent dehydrogenase (short-subunit alcohol dehydrogenase family)